MRSLFAIRPRRLLDDLAVLEACFGLDESAREKRARNAVRLSLIHPDLLGEGTVLAPASEKADDLAVYDGGFRGFGPVGVPTGAGSMSDTRPELFPDLEDAVGEPTFADAVEQPVPDGGS